MPTRALILIAVVLAAILGRAAGAQAYVERFDPNTPPQEVMGGVLSVGRDGAWHGSLEDGGYVLENEGDAGAIRYFWLGDIPGPPDQPPAALAVSVDVDGAFEGEISGAGLIFRFDPERRFYYGFVLLNGGRYGFFQRDQDGVQMRLSGTSEAIEAGGENRLTIVPEGDTMNLFVNGERIGAFGNDAVQGPGVGIVAIGIGRFHFDDFAIGEVEAGGDGGDTFAAPPASSAGRRGGAGARAHGGGVRAQSRVDAHAAETTSGTLRESAQFVSDVINDVNEHRQDAQDESSRRFASHIRGVPSRR